MYPEMANEIAQRQTDFGLALTDCERITLVFKDVESSRDFDAAVRLDKERKVIWWTIFLAPADRPFDRKKLLDKILPKAPEQTYQGRAYHKQSGNDPNWALYFHSDRVFVLGPEWGVRACIEQVANPKTEGPLKAAIKAATGKHHLVAGIVPPARTVEQWKKDRPEELKKYDMLLGAQSLLATGTLNGTLELELTLAFADAARAEEAKPLAESLKNLLVDKLEDARTPTGGIKLPPEESDFFERLVKTLKNTAVEQKKDAVVVQMKCDVLSQSPTLKVVIDKIRGAVHLAQRKENLRKLGEALNEYQKTNKQHLPARAIYKRDGNNKPIEPPLLSWRVELLPYLGEQELYKQFKLNERWDSKDNKLLLTKMPKVYRMPGQSAGDPKTYYQVFTGQQTPFEGSKEFSLKDVKDGLDKTLGIVEAPVGVEWTKPSDIEFNANDKAGFPSAGIGRKELPEIGVLMLDGSVRTISKRSDLLQPLRLKALITPNAAKPFKFED